MKKTIRINTNIVFGIIAIVFSVCLWLIIPNQIKETSFVKDYVSARLFPNIISGIMFFCGVICIIKGIVLKQTKEFNIHLEGKALIFLIVLLAYAICAYYISFLLASIFFTVGTLVYIRSRDIKKYIIAVSISTAACLIFKFLLEVKFGGLWGI